MPRVRAVLFDLHGTLAYIDKPISDVEIIEYLYSRGYDVSPQQLKASWFYVSMIDYPKYGYKNWYTYFTQIFRRLDIVVDKQTLNYIARILESKPYKLYPDAYDTVIKIKEMGLKTAIVTTIAKFQFEKAIEPIQHYLDSIITGYEAGCDKSNPKMYKKTLEILGVKPEEAIMIGDDIYLDIILPKRLGIKTILLNRSEETKAVEADAAASSLREALEIITTQF